MVYRFTSSLFKHIRLFASMSQHTMNYSVSLRPLVLCGPSGSGKSTLLKRLMSEYTDSFGFSISHTTRQPRQGETHGVEYYFVTRSEMEAAIQRGDFIETAEFSGNLYGTSKRAVQEVAKIGKICVLDIDTQGVKILKKTDLNPRYVFIRPPSVAVLEKRLRDRGTESESAIQKRLNTAKQELEYASEPGAFDIIIENDDVELAYQSLRAFVLPDIERLAMQKVRID